MCCWLLLMTFLSLISIIPTASNAKKRFRYSITTVNVRTKPNTNSKIVGQLHWNEKVRIIREVNREWYLIQYRKKKRYVCAEYLTKRKYHYKSFTPPSNSKFKSYEDADCITNSRSLAEGRLKVKYHLDDHTGVWMVGDRYCIAIGSFYTTKIGAKVDLVLLHGDRTHTLKCITADSKADKDTVDQHRIHRDGSVVEFVVKTSSLPGMARRMGDVSYAGNKFKGKVEQIRVYG